MIVNVSVVRQFPEPTIIEICKDDPLTVVVDTVTRTVADDVEVYSGPYVAIPTVNSQTLPTAKKLMTGDVTVRGVPFYEVTNQQGGNTVYIAKE